MPSLPELQRTLLGAGCGDVAEVARAGALLCDGPGLSAARRLRIYQHNRVESLVAALAAVYPVLRQLLGDGCFDALARDHVRAHPSRSGDVSAYGREFGRLLSGSDALRAWPWMADMAALEWAYHEAYHEGEAEALQASDLAAVASAALSSLRLELQPSARLVASDWPVLTIWLAHQPAAQQRLEAIAMDGGERVMVRQRELEIEFVRLGEGEHAWLHSLGRGCSLSEAQRDALAREPAFDLSAALARHLALRSFVRRAS
jgi:hypothetical protein